MLLGGDMAHRHALHQLFATTALLLLGGCASLPPSEEAIAVRMEQPVRGWWYASFQANWPEGAEPEWHLDPLLAVEVIGPVLEQHREVISLWRLHRRAARDAAGHRLSLIFYCTPAAARRVYADIRRSEILEDLESTGKIVSVHFDRTERVSKPGIGDTSDPNWSPTIQNTWPYFIMGVSRTWLELSREFAREEYPEPPKGIAELEMLHRRVNAKLTTRWQEEGGHAFLHHLNAVFGYQPLLINQREMQRF